MIRFLGKFVLSAFGPLVIAIPAVAADLIPYDNGYIPGPYDQGPPGADAYSGYGPNGSYGAEGYCDINGGPLADDPEGSPRPCEPVRPYPATVVPNGPENHYAYRPGYQAAVPPSAAASKRRYGDYSYQPGYELDRGPSAVAPKDRYDNQAHRPGYGPGRSPAPIVPNGSYQPNYESASPPAPIAPNDRYGDDSYQPGYGSDRPPSAMAPNDYARPSAALPPDNRYHY